MDKPNFHDRMMNIQARPASMIVGSVSTYTRGHMDARHDAAKIAFEADARIEALEALVQDMAGALRKTMLMQEGIPMTGIQAAQWLDEARAALAKHKEVMTAPPQPTDEGK